MDTTLGEVPKLLEEIAEGLEKRSESPKPENHRRVMTTSAKSSMMFALRESLLRCMQDQSGYHFDFAIRNFLDQERLSGNDKTLLDMISYWERELDLKKKRGLTKEIVETKMTAAVCSATFHAHALHGQQTFVLGENVFRMLSDTSLAGVKLEEVKLPYECFYIALPESSSARLWGGRTGWHKCEGIYIRRPVYFEKSTENFTSEGGYPANPQDVLVQVVAKPNERSEMYGDDANAWTILNCNRLLNYPDIETFARERERVETLDAQDDDRSWDLSYGNEPQESTPEEDGGDVNRKTLFSLVRVALNAVLYINNGLPAKRLSGPTDEEENKRAYLENRVKNKKTKKSRERLRRSIVHLMRPTVRQIGPSFERTSPTYTANDICVRGHWWPREDTDLHEKHTRWIKPYKRRKTENPEISEEARVHVVHGGA